MHKQEYEPLDLRSPKLWSDVEPGTMWSMFRAHVDRNLDAVLPQGRPRAVVRLAAADAPAHAPGAR